MGRRQQHDCIEALKGKVKDQNLTIGQLRQQNSASSQQMKMMEDEISSLKEGFHLKMSQMIEMKQKMEYYQ